MTPARDDRPTRRELAGRLGDPYVVELSRSVLTIRPKGARSSRARVSLEVGQLYVRAIARQLELEKQERRRGRQKRVSR
jgi:hypothetical protein